MEIRKLQAQIEAILFTMGEAIEGSRLAQALSHDEHTIQKVIRDMMDHYESEDRGIQIIELDGSYQLSTKTEYYESIVKLVHVPKKQVLTDVLLETLSIVAYKQPITKVEIEAIRGVKCDHAINKLIEYDLVCEVGRLDAPGKPILFGTTEEFLRSFGIQSLEELPVPDEEQVEDFKIEAQEEVQLKLQL